MEKVRKKVFLKGQIITYHPVDRKAFARTNSALLNNGQGFLPVGAVTVILQSVGHALSV